MRSEASLSCTGCICLCWNHMETEFLPIQVPKVFRLFIKEFVAYNLVLIQLLPIDFREFGVKPFISSEVRQSRINSHSYQIE